MTTRKRALHVVLGVVVASSLSIPTPPPLLSAIVLTQTSAATVNPLEWNEDFTGYQTWDGVSSGDKHVLRWRRVNGGAWTTEVEQGLDEEMLTGGFTWPLWEAAKSGGFLSGGYVEIQEQRARYAAGVELGRSAWSNALVDNLAAPAFAPSSLFGVGDIGYAWNTTDDTKLFSDAGLTNLVGQPTGTAIARVQDISGLGNNLNYNGTSSTRPTRSTSSSGLIVFDGVDDELDGIGGFYAKGAMTWIGIVKGLDTGAAFLWAETSSGNTNPAYAPGLRGSANNTNMLNWQRNDAAAVVNHSMVAALMNNVLHVYMVTDDGSTISVSVAGAAFVTDPYVRSGAFTLNRTTFGMANVAGTLFGPEAYSLGSGMVISRVLAGTLGTAGTEKTNAYNYFAALHGLATL